MRLDRQRRHRASAKGTGSTIAAHAAPAVFEHGLAGVITGRMTGRILFGKSILSGTAATVKATHQQ
jgi:hypothetical protein